MSGSKFQLEPVPGATVSNDELLRDIQRVAQLAGANVISARQYQRDGKYSHTTASKRFGTWNKAVIAAGLDVTHENDICDERLFENLMRLWEHYGRQPRRRELAHLPSIISQGPYKRRFRSWMDALAQFIAYANAQDARPPTPTEDVSGRKTGRDPSLRMRFRVMKRDNFACRACGASPALQPGLSLHVDHIEAWSRGGRTIDENLQTLCRPCNLGKSNAL
ncbi:MAG: HNH endonuclease [Alphaproteobacteria bacterium]|nr:HNH endonuclease [Alphaproteobacteria bacterium]